MKNKLRMSKRKATSIENDYDFSIKNLMRIHLLFFKVI